MKTLPWDRIGEKLVDCTDASEAMKAGGLDNWNVRKVPMFAQVERKKIVIPGMNAIVRDTPSGPAVLGKYGVSDSYETVQNEEQAGLLDALVSESGSEFTHAGTMNNGTQTFLNMKLPGQFHIGGTDPVENYIAAMNSHDGSMSFTLMMCPVRVNGASLLNVGKNVVRIRHSSGVNDGIERQAREALDRAFVFLERFQIMGNRMADSKMSSSKFEAILAREFYPGDNASQSAFTRSTKKVEEMVSLFNSQTDNQETCWAGLAAMCEWSDHFAPTRGDDRENSRAQKSILDPSFKNEALQLMLENV